MLIYHNFTCKNKSRIDKDNLLKLNSLELDLLSKPGGFLYVCRHLEKMYTKIFEENEIISYIHFRVTAHTKLFYIIS